MRAGSRSWYVRRGRAFPPHIAGISPTARRLPPCLSRPSSAGVARPCSLPRSRAGSRSPSRSPSRALSTRPGAAGPSLGQLQSQLGAQQSRQQHLSSSIGSLNELIDKLDSQISLVQSREQAVADELSNDRAKLKAVHRQLIVERALLVKLKAKLAAGRRCWPSSSSPGMRPTSRRSSRSCSARRLSGPAQPAQLPRARRARAEDADQQHHDRQAQGHAGRPPARRAAVDRPPDHP